MDVAVFKPLKTAWCKAVRAWKEENDSTNFPKEYFCSLMGKILKEQIKPEWFVSGFRSCGLFPFNADNIDYRKTILRRHHGTIENFAEANENDLFFSKIEENIDTQRLIQFRETGDKWKGDVEATDLFYFWKKAKNALDDFVAVGNMNEIDETHNQNNDLISEEEIAAWNVNGEETLIETISETDLLKFGYPETMIDKLILDFDNSSSVQTPVDIPSTSDAKKIHVISNEDVTNVTTFDVGKFLVPAASTSNPVEINNEDSIPFVSNTVEVSSEKDIPAVKHLQSKSDEVQLTVNDASQAASTSVISAKVAVSDENKHQSMSVVLSGVSAKVDFSDENHLQSMSVLSSEAYIQMMRAKSEKKRKAEETKIENKLKRLKKKEEKEKALKEKVPKVKKTKCTIDKSKPKSNEDRDGNSGSNPSCSMVGYAHVQYKLNQHVLIRTGNLYIPGKIKQIDENRKYRVRLMLKSGPSYWKWPEKSNYLWIKGKQIESVIKPPKKVSNRGQYSVEEMIALFQQPLFK